MPGLYRQVGGAGAEPRAKAPDDALRAPTDPGLVSTQCARDRVERLAVEKHREHRQIVMLELRHRRLEEQQKEWRERSLEEKEYPYLYLDATYLKARWGARVGSMALLVCVGVEEEGSFGRSWP